MDETLLKGLMLLEELSDQNGKPVNHSGARGAGRAYQ